MSFNTNAKVNPFYIQDDEEDPWDDDDEEDEYGDDEYDDEQVMLISGNGGSKNRMYNESIGVSNGSDSRQTTHFGRSYHDGWYDSMRDRNNQHTPQLWKYGIILFTIIGVAVFGSSLSSSESDGDGSNGASSLVDEIPNNEYQIVVLGERHSGTKWMRDRLKECFPDLEVSTHLQRMGYFFQDDEATARSKEISLGNKPETATDNTIVVHVTLNVYDWLEQMRLSPEYAPNHAGKHHQLGHPIPLEWEEFLSRAWTTERPPNDLSLANETGPVCQMGFHYNEVVSCMGTNGGASIGDPMYELQPKSGDGHPFESILDLRTAKLKNHHGVMNSWPSVKKMIQISYETTAEDFKTKLLHEIHDFVGGNDAGSYESLPCDGGVMPPSLDSSNEMTLEYIEFVTDNADWDTENQVASYHPWTEDEIASKGIRPTISASSESESVTANEGAVPGEDNEIKAVETKGDTVDNSDESSVSASNQSSPEENPETNTENDSKETKAAEDNTTTSSSSNINQNVEDYPDTVGSDTVQSADTNPKSNTQDDSEEIRVGDDSSISSGSNNNQDTDNNLEEAASDTIDDNLQSVSLSQGDSLSSIGNNTEESIQKETGEKEEPPPTAQTHSSDEKKIESPTNTGQEVTSISYETVEQNTIEKGEEDESSLPPTEEKNSSEAKNSESSIVTDDEEVAIRGDEISNDNEIPKEKDDSKVPTMSESNEEEEEEEEQSYSASVAAESTSTLGEASDTAVDPKSDTAEEGKSTYEKGASSGDITNSKEESLSVKKDKGDNEDKTNLSAEPTADEKEEVTNIENDKVLDNEKDDESENGTTSDDRKETESDGKNAENVASKPEDALVADDDKAKIIDSGSKA